MNPTEKQRIMDRLRNVGLWNAADSHRELVRLRRRDAGEDRETAARGAWEEVWAIYEPVCDRLERQARQRKQAAFIGYEGDVDDLIDPDYNQPDAGKRIRDAFVWAGDEFRRITTDSPDGTRMDFGRAKTPPPTPLAIQVAEHCAMQSAGKRAELLGRLAGFATKTHTADDAGGTDPEEEAEGGDGYLDRL